MIPYSGLGKVTDGHRTWRVRETLAPGWYIFTIEGRFAKQVDRAEPQWDSWDLVCHRGYLAAGRFHAISVTTKLLGLPEDEEGERFTPVMARRWFDKTFWFDAWDFEDEVEFEVREAFEMRKGISEIKGITPPLAQAFLLEETARSLKEEAQRRAEAERSARKRAEEILRRQRTVEERLTTALSHSGATLVDWRRNGRNEAVVKYHLGGGRYECVVDLNSLRILDAGICLDGTDRRLNLSSLPSAVREAVETGQLYVMR